MCQRKDCGPRCFSDSNATLNSVSRKLEKLTNDLDAVNRNIVSLHSEGLTTSNQRKLQSLVKQKAALVSKVEAQKVKHRSVLRDVDGTKTGRKALMEKLDATPFGSAEWKELNVRRINADVNLVQRMETVNIMNSNTPAPIRFVPAFAAA